MDEERKRGKEEGKENRKTKKRTRTRKGGQRAKEKATHLHPTQQVSQASTPPPSHQALSADTSPTTP
jgi:hypothetical protein